MIGKFKFVAVLEGTTETRNVWAKDKDAAKAELDAVNGLIVREILTIKEFRLRNKTKKTEVTA